MRLPGFFARPALLWVVVVGMLVGLSAGLSSCTSLDPAPLYVDMNYQVRCGDCMPRSADDLARDIKTLNGENNYIVACDAASQGGKRQLSFSVQHPGEHASDGYKFSVAQALIDGKDPGSSCKVRVIEGGNTYVGGCTSGAPSSENPCQLTFKLDGSIVTGTIWCKAIPNGANNTSVRDVVTPYTMNKPIPFEVDGCTGL